MMQNTTQNRGISALVLLACCLLQTLPAVAMLANPEFEDADGDGVPEGWELKTYILEDMKGVRCLSMKFPRHSDMPLEGEANTVFEGPEGFYRVVISYLDEFDGVSKGKFLVNEKILRIWNFDSTFADVWREEVIENVELKPGDRITFRGRDNPSEYCRIRSIRVEPSPNPPTPEELAEMRTPPVIEEKNFGPLVPLAELRDLSSESRRPEFRPLFSGRNSSILVMKKAGEEAFLDLELDRPKNPTYAVFSHGPSANGMEKPETPLAEGALLFDENDSTARITLPAAEGGLFEVKTPATYLAGDPPPHVLPVQTSVAEKNRGGAAGGFYFFVPKGTKAFGVGAYSLGDRTAEVTVHAPDGSLVTQMDVPKDAQQGIPIRVRPGQDDAVWTLNVSGVSPVIRLTGIPPFLATHPRYLLVPEETILRK